MTNLQTGKFDLAVLQTIDSFWRNNYLPPATNDIMRANPEISSSSLVRYIIRKLEKQGKILVVVKQFGSKVRSYAVPLWVKEAIDGFAITNSNVQNQ